MSNQAPSLLKDRFRRRMTALRVSVTDRCDLRCAYCMPEEGLPVRPRNEMLSFEEIQRLVKIFCRLGIRQVRLTGGEPLLRRDLPGLVGMLSGTPGLAELSMTTNATRLAPAAAALKAAGLNRINISLDSLKPARFSSITRGGDLSSVLAGIDRALEVGLRPVKVNTVVRRGINEDEIQDLVEFSRTRGLIHRFLEAMPLGAVGGLNRREFFPAAEIQRLIEARFLLEALPFQDGSTAREFIISGSTARIGIISPVTERFCDSCNRLRLSPVGRLQLCLGHEDGPDLKEPLRSGRTDSDLERLILDFVFEKPAGNRFLENPEPVYQIAMSGIGG